MKDQTRPLTAAEIEKFPGMSSVNVALYHHGQWVYADEASEDPDGELVAMPVTDEDGYYIPIEGFEG